MLVSRSLTLRHRLARVPTLAHVRQRPPCRRHFMQQLCDGFLDLAIALPLPPSLPPYSTTIILVTLVSRFALLPISIWGKNRVRRAEELALPAVERLKPVVYKHVLNEMKKAGIRGDKDELRKTHAKMSAEILTQKRKELFKKYKCQPLPSMIIPPLSQLPFFVAMTVALGRMSVDPTPFDSESFLTLSTLAHPDPTMTLPIILGVLTMANVESSNWVMNAAERERVQKIEDENARRMKEQGKVAIQPRNIIKTSLRILSVGRIIVAAVTPGSITLYWVTSAAFGLVQTWFMDWLDIRRRRRLTISTTPETTKTTTMDKNNTSPSVNTGKHK